MDKQKARVDDIECRGFAFIEIEKIDVSTYDDMEKGYRRLINGTKAFSGAIEVPEKLDPEKQYKYEGVFKYNGETTHGEGNILIDPNPVENYGMWVYEFEGTGAPELEEDITDE